MTAQALTQLLHSPALDDGAAQETPDLQAG